jgi:hypothetical protein
VLCEEAYAASAAPPFEERHTRKRAAKTFRQKIVLTPLSANWSSLCERVFAEVRRHRGMLHLEFLGRPKNLRELLRKTVRESNSVCDPERDKTMFAQSFYAPNKKGTALFAIPTEGKQYLLP